MAKKLNKTNPTVPSSSVPTTTTTTKPAGLRPDRNENFNGGNAGAGGNTAGGGGGGGNNALSVVSSGRRHNVILNCTEENCNKESEWHELDIIGKWRCPFFDRSLS